MTFYSKPQQVSVNLSCIEISAENDYAKTISAVTCRVDYPAG